MMALAMGASATGVQPRAGVRARAVSGRRSTVRVVAMQKVSRDSFAVKSGVDAVRATKTP